MQHVKTPPGALGDNTTRVLLAVMAETHPTWDSVVARTGLSRQPVDAHLHKLRDEGLVTWEAGRKGTLRALVRLVPLRAAS